MHVLFPLKLIQNVSVLFFKAKDNRIEDEQNKAKPKNEKKKESTVVKPWALGKLFPMEL